MSVKVHLKNLHISPRKVRLVAGLIRGLDTREADRQLRFAYKGAAKPMAKLLKSAVATATNDFNMQEDNLKVAEVLVGEGPTMKRWRPRAHGRAFPIMKRSSHITIALEEKVKGKGQKKSPKKSNRKNDKKDDKKKASKKK